MVDNTKYSREDNVYYARLAEQGERYEDMINHMQAVAKVSNHSTISHNSKHASHRRIKSKNSKLLNERKSET